jgi:hypothetical protein
MHSPTLGRSRAALGVLVQAITIYDADVLIDLWTCRPVSFPCIYISARGRH